MIFVYSRVSYLTYVSLQISCRVTLRYQTPHIHLILSLIVIVPVMILDDCIMVVIRGAKPNLCPPKKNTQLLPQLLCKVVLILNQQSQERLIFILVPMKANLFKYFNILSYFCSPNYRTGYL